MLFLQKGFDPLNDGQMKLGVNLQVIFPCFADQKLFPLCVIDKYQVQAGLLVSHSLVYEAPHFKHFRNSDLEKDFFLHELVNL